MVGVAVSLAGRVWKWSTLRAVRKMPKLRLPRVDSKTRFVLSHAVQ